MTTRKRGSGARRTTSRRRTTRSSRSATYRRRTPGLPTTIGGALGALVVTTLLDVSWPVRIGLVGLVVLIGLGYVLWRHRAEIAASAHPDATSPDAAGQPPSPSDPGDASS